MKRNIIVLLFAVIGSVFLWIRYKFGIDTWIVVFVFFAGLFKLAEMTLKIVSDCRKGKPHPQGFGWNKELE